jgi:hypothetical protein
MKLVTVALIGLVGIGLGGCPNDGIQSRWHTGNTSEKITVEKDKTEVVGMPLPEGGKRIMIFENGKLMEGDRGDKQYLVEPARTSESKTTTVVIPTRQAVPPRVQVADSGPRRGGFEHRRETRDRDDSRQPHSGPRHHGTVIEKGKVGVSDTRITIVQDPCEDGVREKNPFDGEMSCHRRKRIK